MIQRERAIAEAVELEKKEEEVGLSAVLVACACCMHARMGAGCLRHLARSPLTTPLPPLSLPLLLPISAVPPGAGQEPHGAAPGGGAAQGRRPPGLRSLHDAH